MSIEGSLQDYTFFEVVAILSHKRESGRLYIDFNCGQGWFDFINGDLTAARVGSLIGFSAVNVALHIEGTRFRFLRNHDISATHFRDKNAQFLRNLLLGNLHEAAAVEPSVEDSKQAQAIPPTSLQPKVEPDQAESKEVLQFESVPTFVTPSLLYIQGRSRASWTVSVLLIGLLAAAAIAAFRSRPIQQAASKTSQQPAAKVNSEEIAPLSGKTDQGSPLADNATPSTSYVFEAAGYKPPPAAKNQPSFPSDDSLKPYKNEPGLVKRTEERGPTPQRSFREIPVVIKIEDGHVAEAYVKDHEPGMEAFESTAIRLARQRRYPKEQLSTQTIVLRVANEQGEAKQ